MSGTDNPYDTPAGTQRSWAPGEAGGAGNEATGVKERVSEAASHAGEAGREAAHDAKEQARGVAHEAADRTRGLVDRTRAELGDQAATQQRHLASGLRSLGDELGQMAGRTDDPGFASDLVQRTGDVTGRAAQWIEDREPGDILREVEDFARRRPGAFIAIAAGAGLLVGRLLRGMKDAPDGDSGDARRDAGEHSGSGGAIGTQRTQRTQPTPAPPAPVTPAPMAPASGGPSSVPPSVPGGAVPGGAVPGGAVPGSAAPQTNGGGTYVERP